MENVLLAVDGSQSCSKAVKAVKDLYDRTDINVTILNVIEKSDLSDFGILEDQEQIDKKLSENKHLKKSSKEIVSSCLANFDEERTTEKVRQGVPSKEICKEAEEGDYDLVVVADFGESNLSDFLLGSTTEKVVRHCNKSVMVVK